MKNSVSSQRRVDDPLSVKFICFDNAEEGLMDQHEFPVKIATNILGSQQKLQNSKHNHKQVFKTCSFCLLDE